MIRLFVHKIISIWLAVLLLFGSTPKEYIHLFTGHKDTVDVHNEYGGLAFDPQHHHCSFLDFSITAFINDIHIPLIEYHATDYISHDEAALAVAPQIPTGHISVRGPPYV